MYSRFYNMLPANRETGDGSVYLLNDEEVRLIRKTERNAVIASALIGAAMILILYVPQYLWSDYFSDTAFELPLLQKTIKFSIPKFLFGQALVFIEVFLLTLLGIYCAHEIGVSTGFIDRNSKLNPEKKDILLKISKEYKTREIHDLGINPYHGLGKTRIFLLNLLFTLKATLSNFLVRLFLQKILGRYAFRIILDFAGIPVFAFWNAMGTRKILRESRVIIMGLNLLEQFEKEITTFRTLSEREKTLLYDTLQLIAVSKRDYHQNHYVLSKMIMNRFEIPVEKEHGISPSYLKEIPVTDKTFRSLNEKIIILGLIIDGHISKREKKRIEELKESGVIISNTQQISAIKDSFVYGKGIAINTI